ncbi:hypothetical protein BT96DRAFT_987071 [Gymnopus androsaceus JB14]|uniref:Uncharacterized protein n=1 Tax=Gymnopus androsaceus JB14 TaxID=1447944 RepID=A0A6A4IDH5_9AGAR|nr:hypothetical protein BT96DRAFT_987071 [Gymnopus androsaceus JB14]
MTEPSSDAENPFDSFRNRNNVANIGNKANLHASEHTWQFDQGQTKTRSVPSEPPGVKTPKSAQAVEFYQQLEKLARVCAEAQKNSMVIARACASAQETSMNTTLEFSKLMGFFVDSLDQGGEEEEPPKSDAGNTSVAGSVSPLMIKPREDVKNLSGNNGETPDVNSETESIPPPIRRRRPATGLAPKAMDPPHTSSGGFNSTSETQVATPIVHAGGFPVNRSIYAMVGDTAMENSIGCLGQVPVQDYEELRRQLAAYDEEQAKVKALKDRIPDPTPVNKLPGAFNNSPIIAFSHTTTVPNTVANTLPAFQANTNADPVEEPHRLRNSDLRNSGVSTYPDQGIGFNIDGYPVNKATMPRKVWDRGSATDPPRDGEEVGDNPTDRLNTVENRSHGGSASRNSRHDPHESEDGEQERRSSSNMGGGPPDDDGDDDGDGRDDRSRKGKKPSRRRRMPWDDDSSSGDSPPSPPHSSPSSSSSEDSSSSDDNWFGTFASNNNLDKKSRHKLRKKTIKKLRAKTEDDKHRESWLKHILHEYKKQIRHYCDREPVQGAEMPKGIKVPNPSKFMGSKDVEEFDTWLLALLRWIVIS